MFCLSCNSNRIVIQCLNCTRHFCCGEYSQKCGFNKDYDWVEPVCKYCLFGTEYCGVCKKKVEKLPCKICVKS